MNKFLTIYIVGYIVSYFLIAGWVNAAFKHQFPDQSHRKQLGSAIGWSLCAAAIWPFFLPGVFLVTGFAEDGWSLTTSITTEDAE